jgi:hypothetical protein
MEVLEELPAVVVAQMRPAAIIKIAILVEVVQVAIVEVPAEIAVRLKEILVAEAVSLRSLGEKHQPGRLIVLLSTLL